MPAPISRDNLLFLLFGAVLGLVVGYLAQDRLGAVQPARVAPALSPQLAAEGDGGAAQGAPAPAGDAGGAPAAGAGGAPAAGAGGAPMAEIQALRDALAKNPNDTRALLRLADMNFDIQRWDKAKELYEKFLSLAPPNPNALTDLGICERNLGQPKSALERFRQAEKLDATHWQSRFNEVVVLAFDVGDLGAAEKALADLERLQPDNPDIQRLAAEVKKRREGS